MALTEGRVAKPEWLWGCCHSTPLHYSISIRIVLSWSNLSLETSLQWQTALRTYLIETVTVTSG